MKDCKKSQAFFSLNDCIVSTDTCRFRINVYWRIRVGGDDYNEQVIYNGQ